MVGYRRIGAAIDEVAEDNVCAFAFFESVEVGEGFAAGLETAGCEELTVRNELVLPIYHSHQCRLDPEYLLRRNVREIDILGKSSLVGPVCKYFVENVRKELFHDRKVGIGTKVGKTDGDCLDPVDYAFGAGPDGSAVKCCYSGV